MNSPSLSMTNRKSNISCKSVTFVTCFLIVLFVGVSLVFILKSDGDVIKGPLVVRTNNASTSISTDHLELTFSLVDNVEETPITVTTPTWQETVTSTPSFPTTQVRFEKIFEGKLTSTPSATNPGTTSSKGGILENMSEVKTSNYNFKQQSLTTNATTALRTFKIIIPTTPVAQTTSITTTSKTPTLGSLATSNTITSKVPKTIIPKTTPKLKSTATRNTVTQKAAKGIISKNLTKTLTLGNLGTRNSFTPKATKSAIPKNLRTTPKLKSTATRNIVTQKAAKSTIPKNLRTTPKLKSTATRNTVTQKAAKAIIAKNLRTTPKLKSTATRNTVTQKPAKAIIPKNLRKTPTLGNLANRNTFTPKAARALSHKKLTKTPKLRSLGTI